MGVFGIVLLVLFSIVCALLIFMVVIQDQEGEGLGGVFAGAGNAAFGSRSSSVVVRITYVLGALFFVIAISLAMLNRSDAASVDKALRATEGQATEWWDKDAAPADPATQAPAETTAPAAETSGAPASQ